MNKFFQFNELVELGKIFMDCEAYLIALEHFDKALELSYLPINKNRLLEAYDCRGCTKKFLGRNESAIIDYTKAIEIDSSDPFLFIWRGSAYEALQEYEEAIKNFKMSLIIDPNLDFIKTIIDHIEKIYGL